MRLTKDHLTALGGLLDRAGTEAAAALAQITGSPWRVEPGPPAVQPAADLARQLAARSPAELAVLRQPFEAPTWGGETLLWWTPEAAQRLATLLTAQDADPGRLDAASQEVVIEAGNLLLNACLGQVAALTLVPLTVTMPDLRLGPPTAVAPGLGPAARPRVAVAVPVTFRGRGTALRADLVIVMDGWALDTLLNALADGAEPAAVAAPALA
jgi:chemotaxis protein CheC